jgi:iron complex transport system substrate-binding protein
VRFRPRVAALRLAALLAALGGFPCASPVVSAAPLIDDRGITVELPSRPTRIIALSPHLAELAFAAGAGSQLAAVVRYSDYPDAARSLPQVGDGSRIDIERVIAIKPDLILGWRSGNPPGDLQRLEDLGFRVFVTEPARLADIARLTRTIGALAGTPAIADAAAGAFERELATLRARYGARSEVPVFYEIWHRPLLTINAAHLISDVIALCGGRNVFAAAPILTPAVSVEAVLAARPRVVLGGSSATRPETFAAAWREMPAESLRRLPVRYVPPDLIQRQTLRIAQGARVVCEHLEAVRREGDVRR